MNYYVKAFTLSIISFPSVVWANSAKAWGKYQGGRNVFLEFLYLAIGVAIFVILIIAINHFMKKKK